MHESTGWSRALLNGGLSLGLLVWGVGALPVGAWIRRRGGRGIMTSASLVGALATCSMAFVTNPASYFAVWIVIGLSMAGLLYEPAFAVVTKAFGSKYRRGITVITLVAGLASTAFLPLAQLAVAQLGWRHAWIALGLVVGIVCVPLHFFGIPRIPVLAKGCASWQHFAGGLRQWASEFRRDASDRRVVGLAIWFTGQTAAFSGLTFLLVPILQAAEVPMDTILQAVVLIGPMQVAGRLLLATRIDHFSVLRVGIWAMTAFVGSILVLLLTPHTLPWLVAFAVIYGGGLGVMTILKGSAVVEIFGAERYAELNGVLACPAILATALAPTVLAGLWTLTGYPSIVLIGVLAIAAAGFLGLLLTCRAVQNS